MDNHSPRMAILISPDPLSRSLLFQALQNVPREAVLVIADQSMSTRKILKLLAKKRIRFTWLVKKFLSLAPQGQVIKSDLKISLDRTVKNNQELAAILKDYPNLQVLLGFRASLIVQGFITEALPSLNIHCARLPDYAGLEAISKALNEGAYEQVATLHEMVSKIDSGKVLDEEPYILEPTKPYWKNELTAYRAGVPLIQRLIHRVLNPVLI